MKGIHKHKILLIPLSMLAVTLIAGYFLSHIPLGANATTSDVSLHVADTCTMNGIINEGDEHTVSLINGQERTGIGITRLTTLCNDNNGYAIYAIGYSGTTSDPHNTAGELGRTDLVGLSTGLTISTANWADRNTGDNAAKSIWSMSLQDNSEVISSMKPTIENGFSSYLSVPTTYTKVASFPAATGATLATASIVNTTYAAKVATVQSSDTYVGQVKYTMVHPSSNSATGFTFDDAFQLAGKSRVSGTSYFAMQDMNAAICNKVTTPLTADAASTPQAQLIDIRDNKVYWVAKLMDGKCWMAQNLDFDITGPLDSTTTNLTVAGVAPYTDGYVKDPSTGVITWTPASTAVTIHTGRDKTGPDGEINYGTNAGKWADSNKNPYSVDPGEWYQSGAYFASSVCNNVSWSTGCNFLNSAKNTAQDGVTALTTYFRQTPYADNGTHGAIGNWYNWSAAVAANDTSAITSGTLTNSVCPAGWELPANGEYGTINTNYNSNADSGALDAGLFSAPLYFVRGGSINTNGTTTLYGAGRYGIYWSGTTYSADSSYDLYFRSSYVSPANGSDHSYGASVRCVVDDSMQSFDQDAAASLAINESLTLRDTRDNQEYTVAKLRDDKVWLLDNLRLGGDTEITLTPSDTNIATNFTLPASAASTSSMTKPLINSDFKDNIVDSSESNTGKIGVYYNYCAASAGTICVSGPTDTATSDICPRGWRLPLGGDQSEFENLYQKYQNNGDFIEALNIIFSGAHSGNGTGGTGNGNLWSTGQYPDRGDSTYYLRYEKDSNIIYPNRNLDRSWGISVRCVLSAN